MPRPRSLSGHAREFFAFTEELLASGGAKSIDCGPGEEGRTQAFVLRAGMYHFWAKLRKEIEATRFNPAALDELAQSLIAAGKLRDMARGFDLRALYRVAANSTISIDGDTVVKFSQKGTTKLAQLLASSLTTLPTSPVEDHGASLLRELDKDEPKLG